MRRYIHTILPRDVGKSRIKTGIGGTINIGDAFGPVQELDVGKRVYNVDGVIQVENNEQRDARTAPKKNPRRRVRRNPLDRKQAQNRITAALNTLRIYGWTVEQRHRLIEGLHREDAVEAAERAVQQIGREKPKKNPRSRVRGAHHWTVRRTGKTKALLSIPDSMPFSRVIKKVRAAYSEPVADRILARMQNGSSFDSALYAEYPKKNPKRRARPRLYGAEVSYKRGAPFTRMFQSKDRASALQMRETYRAMHKRRGGKARVVRVNPTARRSVFVVKSVHNRGEKILANELARFNSKAAAINYAKALGQSNPRATLAVYKEKP